MRDGAAWRAAAPPGNNVTPRRLVGGVPRRRRRIGMALVAAWRRGAAWRGGVTAAGSSTYQYQHIMFMRGVRTAACGGAARRKARGGAPLSSRDALSFRQHAGYLHLQAHHNYFSCGLRRHQKTGGGICTKQAGATDA